MSSPLHSIAVALMVPGNRPDRFDRAFERCGHAMIIDLEDAVPVAEKPAARRHVGNYLSARSQAQASGHPLVGVRICGLASQAALDDLVLLRDLENKPDFVALPMVESERDVVIARAALGQADIPFLAIIETVEGLDSARSIATVLDGNGGLGFGAADYCAQTGMAMKPATLSAARTRIVEAAVIGRVPAFDVPYLDIRDEDGLAREAALNRELGFSGKLAIHPGQVDTIIAAFRPSADELAGAERIIAAFEDAGGKAIQVDGRMIDQPLYDQAIALRARGS
ncbi:MAG: CoA ester lyase [Pseudomonadota bacterium]